MPTLPFCKPAYQRVPRQGKLDRQARPCYFLNFGYNHGNDCMKIMDAETGRIVHSRDVTWHQPREPLISPAPTVGSEVPHSPSGVATPDHIHIQPTPAATTAPVAAPVPASDNAAPAPPPNPTASTRDGVVRELGRERREHVRSHAGRDASDVGVSAQHGSDVSRRFGSGDSLPRGVRRGVPRA